jgi:flavin reductase (DIM6/NTAB) family NADH-FMN oxidoreductase RutF
MPMWKAEANPDDFKGAMGSWAAGVTVVTTKHGDLVYGITVSSFTSLSIEPLLVEVALQNRNRLVDMIRQSGRFAVSILAEGQQDISGYFASGGREPAEAFPKITTTEWHTGSPIIAGALAHVDCELHEMLPGGDHTIVVGRVLGAAYNPDLNPLLYFRREYRTLRME